MSLDSILEVIVAALIVGILGGSLVADLRERRERRRESLAAWISRRPGSFRGDEYVVVHGELEVALSRVILDARGRESLIAIRAVTITGHDPPRVHRANWGHPRLPIAVDAADEVRACCRSVKVTAPHAIASDGRTVLAWVEPPVPPEHLDAVIDEVAAIARERPLLDDPERIEPSRGGPFR
jgi:hypothetical protein